MVRSVLVRLIVAILMELVLALMSASFFMQIFPMTLFVWVIYDATLRTKIIKIQTPLELPKDLRKQLEKHAKKQLKDIEKGLLKSDEPAKKNEEKK